MKKKEKEGEAITQCVHSEFNVLGPSGAVKPDFLLCLDKALGEA